MKKSLIILPVLLLIILGIGIFRDYSSSDSNIENPAYQEYITKYSQQLKQSAKRNLEKSISDTKSIHFKGEGTTGNFEGPQVHISYLKFQDKHFNNDESREMLFFDGNTLNFDPDHSHYGLPNVLVKASPVNLFYPEKKGLQSLLQMGNSENPKPYKTYRKNIIPADSNIWIRELEMQLWLTEFKVTVDILPDRKPPVIPLTENEKTNIKYPGYWYGSTQNQVSLRDLREEWKNNRYGDLSVILKIIPDNAPWYYKNEQGMNVTPAIGIGAVYCSQLNIVNETDERRVSPNIQKGSVVYLHPDYNPVQANIREDEMPANIEQIANEVLATQSGPGEDKGEEFWNQPYYIRLFFNNIGSWREGFLGNRKFDDQVTFTFLMPVFVLGSWDIIPPSEIIPEWDPPAPYFKEFKLKNLLPKWGMGTFGRILSTIGLLVIIGFLLPIIFPAFSKILKVFRRA